HNTSLFFFSSRRRHTRSKRDWSSDVCSSDLPYSFYQDNELVGFDLELMYRFALWCNAELVIEVYDWYGIMPACTSGKVDYIMSRSEERRVGKECRSLWGALTSREKQEDRRR